MAAYDAIVIGTGTAGSYLAERLARSGMKVAAIERKLVGGTCLNVGCTPTNIHPTVSELIPTMLGELKPL
jgi:pyruvate/2-oxoglutarate dehydrogenase complex dihydrolipoamide dehydrogenase (E3) component